MELNVKKLSKRYGEKCSRTYPFLSRAEALT